MSEMLRRRELYVIVFAIVSLVLIIDYFFGQPEVVATGLLNWQPSLYAFAQVFGVLAISIYHFRILYYRRQHWYWSILYFAAFFITLGIGLAPGYGAVYNMLMNDFLGILQISVLGFTGFYSLTIYFRGALGIRTPEVATMMVCCFFGLFLNMPMGEWIWSGFPVIGWWLRNIPGGGGNAGIYMGIGIGTLALYARSLLGYERAFMGEV